MRVGIIGGGAAGFFAAISCKHHHPDAEVMLLEKTSKTLSKVKISGGGRCNVTHDCNSIADLAKFYPRGGKKLKKTFALFSHKDTVSWFESRGVSLKVEDDGRMFPNTDLSQTIIDTLWSEVHALGLQVILNKDVINLSNIDNDHWEVTLRKNDSVLVFDKLIITTGGHPKISSYQWLIQLGLKVLSPVPSLFTFNIPGASITKLMGVVAQAEVRIIGAPYKAQGPLLITHWGMSGPAILKLSSWGARDLADKNYEYEISVNWLHELKQEEILSCLGEESQKKMKNNNPFNLPSRLWLYLLDRATADAQKPWAETPKKSKNRLINTLCHDIYAVKGKTTFKEEFVTCGGIDLAQVDMNTMKSKVLPHLYFAGEVLDIDALTGGFNFQAAWSTGYVAGLLTN